MPLTKQQLARIEERLLEERRRTVEQLSRYARSLSTDPQEAGGEPGMFAFHIADHGTDVMEREQAGLLATEEGRLLFQIDRALRLLYGEPEAFGRCTDCGQPIPFARLEALPWAERCIDCQTRVEQEG